MLVKKESVVKQRRWGIIRKHGPRKKKSVGRSRRRLAGNEIPQKKTLLALAFVCDVVRQMLDAVYRRVKKPIDFLPIIM
jgi:hypothetical protein